jgi:hypothetical protein
VTEPTPAGQRLGCLIVLVAMGVSAAVLAILAFGLRAVTHNPEPTPSITRSTR